MAEPGAEPSEAISVEDDNDSSVTRERQVASILDKLRAPSSSDLSRKRKLASKTTGGNRRANAKVSNPQYEPKISAKKRLEDFKEETLKVVRGNVLFCLSCKEAVSLKKVVLEHSHI